MIQIKVDAPLRADTVKRGEGAKGEWELIKVNDEHSRKSVTIWNTNPPSEIVEGGTFKVTAIEGITYKSRQYNGKWFDEFNITALVQEISRHWIPAETPNFAEIATKEELPF